MNTRKSGYIALMATIIISLVLLIMAVEESSSGWYTRFNILGTEAKEQANSLAEGCAEQAMATLLSDPTYTGDVTTTNSIGSCHVLPIQINYPVTGLVTIKTQAVVNGSYANLDMAMNMNSIHLGAIPTAPTTGTLFITTHVINDSSGTKTASNFTMNVSANPSSSFAGTETGIAVIVQPGAYSVTENPLPNYTVSQTTDCSGNIIAGGLKFCTITNDDITTTLTLIANVVNNNNGTNIPNSFPLFIDGAPVTLGNRVTVTAGAHTVSATTLAGYAVSPWGYDCFSTGNITMALGQNKTCVINFDDLPPPAPSCADTVMILDRTGSMSSSDLTNERTAANALVGLYAGVLPPATPPQIGVGSIGGLYGSTAAQVPDNTHPIVGWLTTVYSTITNAVTTMTSSNSSVGSDLSAGINVAAAELNSSRHIAGKQKVIILVSDGDPNEPSGSTAYDTGFKTPTSNTQNGVGDLWTNPTGAYVNGDSSDANNNTGVRHRFFGFFGASPAIPTGSTITGIDASIDSWSSTPATTTTTSLTPSSVSLDQWNANSGTEVSAVSSNNADTTYIDTSSAVETFVVPNTAVPAGATINSVTIHAVARSTTLGTIMQLVTEKSGTVNIGSNISLTTSYVDYPRVMTTDPSTGATWTLAEVNAWTTGFGVRSINGSAIPRVTQLYVVVNYTPAGQTSQPNPTTVANYDQWTANGSANKTTDILTNDGDSNYISESTLNDAETYTFAGSSVPAGATITNVTVSITARDSTSGAVIKIRAEKGTGAGSQNDGSTITPTNSYQTYTRSMPTNPFTGLAWTLAEVNTWTTKFGVVKTNSSGTVRVTEINLFVDYTLPSAQSSLTPSSVSLDQWNANSGTEVSAVSSNNADTTYIDTSSAVETFVVPNTAVPAGATINSVTIHAVARSTTLGTIMQLVTEKSGTVNIGSNISLTTSYVDYPRVMTTDPSTGATWTLAEVNAWTTGFGVRSINGSAIPRVTQLYVVVNYNTPATSSGCQLGVDLSWNGGTTWSTQKTATLTGTDTTFTLGSPSDDWSGSHTWAISEFSDTNFRARLQDLDPGSSCLDAATTHVDALQIKVHYTQNVDPIVASLNAADAAKLAGVDIFTIHFGSDPSGYTGNELLANLASGNTSVVYSGTTHQNGSLADPGGITNGTTGLILPSSQSADTGGDGNGFEVTPTNAYADGPSGTAGAAQNIDGSGDRQRYYGYNFAIPPGATITGIGTRLDWWLDSTSGTNSMTVELSWDGGATWVSKNDSNESTSVSNSRTLGGAGDTWGRTWSTSELDPSKFRVRMTSNSSSSSRDFYLDWIPVTIYYSVNTENSDGDNFFIAPTSADMQSIFNFIGNQVCPAALNLAATPPPTTGSLLVMTQVTNNNGGAKLPSDFIANVSAVNPSQTSFAGSATGISVTVDPGAYNVAENDVSGYTESPGAVCSSSGSLGPIVAGEARVCVLNNDDIPPPPPPPNLNFDPNYWHEVPTAN